MVHLLLSTEGLDDAQSAQCFFHLTHGVAPESLRLDALCFQLSAHIAHKPTHNRYDDKGKQCELPGNKDKCRKIADNQNRILEKHLQTGHDAVFYLLHITAHTSNNVTFAFLREKAQRQRCNLLVELVTDISHHTGTNRNDGGCRQEISACLEECSTSEEQANQQQGGCLPIVSYQSVDVIIHIVQQHRLDITPVPCHHSGGSLCITGLEQYLQDRYQGSK